MTQNEIWSFEIETMLHRCCFVVLGFVGEVLEVVVLRVLLVEWALVAVATEHNNIYFLFLRAFFCSLFLVSWLFCDNTHNLVSGCYGLNFWNNWLDNLCSTCDYTRCVLFRLGKMFHNIWGILCYWFWMWVGVVDWLLPIVCWTFFVEGDMCTRCLISFLLFQKWETMSHYCSIFHPCILHSFHRKSSPT